MKQLSILRSVFYHIYPGILITLFFILVTPYFVQQDYPPQLVMLVAIGVIVVPVFLIHLFKVKKEERARSILDLVPYKHTLAPGRLLLYTSGLIVFAFIIYGLTQPLNVWITEQFLYWLPSWYKVQDFEGYSREIILITLLVNLLLNGLIAPYIEEVYFRGYLLPRMQIWGRWAPFVSAVLFSLYHFWQPQIYLTIFLALLPMTYLVWKERSLKLAIYTHCGLNIIGAILSFALLLQ